MKQKIEGGKNRVIQSKTILNFKEYPIGEVRSEHFKLMPKAEYLTINFKKDGTVDNIVLIYKSHHSVQMETTHEYL